LAVATGGYIGYIPVAPGTWGSVLGVAVYWLVSALPLSAALLLTALLAAVAVWIAHQAEIILRTQDPGQIVIDEVIGMMVALTALPMLPMVWIAAFFLFRFFDILKPFPIGYLEKKCPGGLGIVIDDVIAGVAANLLLRVLLIFEVPPLIG